MSKMTSQEYKDIVDLLADKGLVERPKPLDYDPGERVCITGWQASFEPARTPTGPFNVARFLGDLHPIKKDESNFPDGNTEKPEQKAQKDREDRIQMFRIAPQEDVPPPCRIHFLREARLSFPAPVRYMI